MLACGWLVLESLVSAVWAQRLCLHVHFCCTSSHWQLCCSADIRNMLFKYLPSSIILHGLLQSVLKQLFIISNLDLLVFNEEDINRSSHTGPLLPRLFSRKLCLVKPPISVIKPTSFIASLTHSIVDMPSCLGPVCIRFSLSIPKLDSVNLMCTGFKHCGMSTMECVKEALKPRGHATHLADSTKQKVQFDRLGHSNFAAGMQSPSSHDHPLHVYTVDLQDFSHNTIWTKATSIL